MLVAGEFVEDDDVSGSQLRDQHLLDVGLEAIASIVATGSISTGGGGSAFRNTAASGYSRCPSI